MIQEFVAGRSKKERAILAIVAGGVAAGTIDILYAGFCYGWDLILAISAGLVGMKALRVGGVGYYALGLLLHFLISLTFAAFYYASSRKWTFLRDSWIVCGLAYGAAVQIVMMYLVLPFLTATHPHGPYELNEVLVGLGAHMVVIGLPISYSVWLFTSSTDDRTQMTKNNNGDAGGHCMGQYSGQDSALNRSNALLAIGVGGGIAGIVDLLLACLELGWDIPLQIAEGLLGARAEHGGAGTYALGVALHFFIAFSAAAAYYAASRRLPFMTEYPLVCGLYFGVTVKLVMHLIVFPLCAFHATDPLPIRDLIVGLLQKMIIVGLPISYSVRWFASRPPATVRFANSNTRAREEIA